MRLIDADNLTQKLYMLTEVLGTELVHIDTIVDHIENQPTIDAVEVVRCKDCKWFEKAGCAIYIVDDSDRPKETDYCSFGERKEE